MTRKDIERIAAALNAAQPKLVNTPEWQTWAHTVETLARMCKDDNPRFDTNRFLEACAK
jgi:hypothetical protein